MKNIQFVICIIVLLIQCKTSEPPFLKDVLAFRQADAISKPNKDIILFIGSSSFTYWKDVQTDLNNAHILNRGFGGSTLVDLYRYKDDIIFSYQPKQIVIYCGDNDIAYSNKVTGYEVFKKFKRLYQSIRDKFPAISVVYISIKPSPARWQMRDRAKEANHLIGEFLTKEKNASFVNIWDKMLNEKGYPASEVFTSDSLHMNKLGYKIWVKELNQYIIK